MSQFTVSQLTVAVGAAVLLAAPSGAAAASSGAAPRHAVTANAKASATSGASKRVAPRERKRGPKLPRGVRLLGPYTGPTGEVLHIESVRIAVIPEDNTEYRSASASWTELGGGRRQREVSTSGPAATRVESWSTPQLSVIRMLGPGSPAPAGDLRCASAASLASAGAAAEIAIVRAGQARVAAGEALPSGPTLDGRATVAVDVGELRAPLGGSIAGTSDRLVLDRATGQPLQRIVGWLGGPTSTTTFERWEVLPAGGSAAQLGRAVPLDTRFNPVPDCDLTDRWVRGEF